MFSNGRDDAQRGVPAVRGYFQSINESPLVLSQLLTWLERSKIAVIVQIWSGRPVGIVPTIFEPSELDFLKMAF